MSIKEYIGGQCADPEGLGGLACAKFMNFFNAEHYRAVKKFVCKLDGARILDIGFGNGVTIKKLSKNINAKFYGVDISADMVEKAKDYIKEGDIFQVVLSNRLEAEMEGSLFNTYKILRKLNPSPYMFYFSSNDIEMAGASPETLVKLKDGKLSTYPLAGTLSGAPKIRAMQIINELENNKRGIYGGAVGYIDLTGNLDTCIAIRLAYKKHSKVYVRSGAGIVADSVTVKEHNECINKAKAVMTALNASGEEE